MATYARLQNADSIEVDNIRSVAGAAFTAPNGMNIDTIAEKTAAAGVTIDGLQIKDSFPILTTTTWAPAPGTQNGTFTGITIAFAKYIKAGGICFCSLYFVGTQNTSNSNYLTFTLPITSANLGNDQYAPTGDTENGTAEALGFMIIKNNSTTVQCYRSAQVQFTPGANRYVINSFSYFCV